jgi:hypothetical protein
MRYAVVTSLVVLVMACSGDKNASDDDDGNSATSSASGSGGGFSSNCPTSPVFTHMTCGSSQANAFCEGTVSCTECGTVATTCTCVPYEAGYEFQCNDDCSTLCSGNPGAGGSGGSGGSAGTMRCETVCARQDAAGCPNTPTGCVADCNAIEVELEADPTCRPDWDAFMECASTATYECDEQGYPYPAACQKEAAAMASCLGLL